MSKLNTVARNVKICWCSRYAYQPCRCTRRYNLDYFNTRTEADEFAAQYPGATVAESSPGIFRVTSPLPQAPP